MPDALHRRLKARAATAGMSLSDYLLEEVGRTAELPTLDEWLARVRGGSHLRRLNTRPADVIRHERDAR